jgi:hypothetical protein
MVIQRAEDSLQPLHAAAGFGDYAMCRDLLHLGFRLNSSAHPVLPHQCAPSDSNLSRLLLQLFEKEKRGVFETSLHSNRFY